MGLAAADVDAYGAGPAVPARAHRGARVDRAATEHRRGEGGELEGRPSGADAGLRAARALLGLQLGVVLRRLHLADGLPGGLHRASAADLLAGGAGPPPPRAPPPWPGARNPPPPGDPKPPIGVPA